VAEPVELPKLLRPADVAEILGVSRARVHSLVRQGILPVIKLGRQVRVSKRALAAFLEEGGKDFEHGWRRGPGDRRAS
jgi:excisionase family DNA binding protein